MKRTTLWILVSLIIASLLLSACAPAAVASSKGKPAKIEPIEGMEFNRVTLTEKAAERLGIQTAPVREEQRTRRSTLVGEVVDNPMVPVTGDAAASGSGNTAAPAVAYVRVRVNEGGRNKVDRVRPALVLSRNPDDEDNPEEIGSAADAFEDTAVFDREDNDSGQATLYYKLNNTSQALVKGSNVWVEVPLQSNEAPQKVIPYAALLYDLYGKTFAYTNPEPLVFIRQPVTVDYIDGDVAVLMDGPSVGTAVVTVGVAELYGADTGIGK